MAGPVLCGVEDSNEAREAARVAGRLAGALRTTLTVVHVVEMHPVPGASVVPSSYAELAASERQRAESEVARVIEDAGVADAEQRVEGGDPARKLAEIAEREGAELVVVGTRTKRGVKAALLGSVSSALVRDAPCPVVLVRGGTSVRAT